jgi:hypothetical protein
MKLYVMRQKVSFIYIEKNRLLLMYVEQMNYKNIQHMLIFILVPYLVGLKFIK